MNFFKNIEFFWIKNNVFVNEKFKVVNLFGRKIKFNKGIVKYVYKLKVVKFVIYINNIDSIIVYC